MSILLRGYGGREGENKKKKSNLFGGMGSYIFGSVQNFRFFFGG
jgi:hypothetical protein